MKYTLRNFENNFQILNSTGVIFVLIGVGFAIYKGSPGVLIISLIGAAMIWLQLRGKRATVDTSKMTVRSNGSSIQLNSPTKLYLNEVRVSQQVNARVNSANFKSSFYKAFIEDGEQKILISSNRDQNRDKKKLKAIAEELGIPFHQNF